jgi:hypothetical protein
MIVLNYVVSSIILHGATVQGTVLLDNSPAVDTYNLSVRKSLANDAHSFSVEVGLCIGRNQYCTIDNQIVGIGGRKTFTFVIDRTGEWKFHETIRMTI